MVYLIRSPLWGLSCDTLPFYYFTINTIVFMLAQSEITFDSYQYERPDLDQFSDEFESLLRSFEAAPSPTAAHEQLGAINDLRNRFNTMYNLCYIRHTVDTSDAFYEQENAWFDQALPKYEQLNNQFYKILVHSHHRPYLEETFGKQLFALAETSLPTFDPVILEDLAEENRLGSRYTKLMAQARIEVDGEVYNMSSIVPLEGDTDRAVRERATRAKYAWLASQREEIEEIFDEMVTVRTRMARKLGYDNYVALGYARMSRTEYGAAEVEAFRKAIVAHAVPIATQLYERQRRRLGVETFRFWDEPAKYRDGNAKPQGEPTWIVEKAEQMYHEMSRETAAFFDFMNARGLLDLTTKDNKSPGGYCTYISDYRSPFIFSNFNGTSHDIDVLTHEVGHAFQVFESRDFKVGEYNFPTYEACEIHSMSMEFFAMPWMHHFFGDQTAKYEFSHMAGAVSFLPYGSAIDHFQQTIYEQPDLTPAERNAVWRDIEQTYLPHRNYGDIAFLADGGFWQRQGHVFRRPFYYIDYVLAQICAFQFWLKDRDDHAAAWSDYHRLCQAGGSKPFLELVDLAGLQSPFDTDTIRTTLAAIREHLEHIDDTAL